MKAVLWQKGIARHTEQGTFVWFVRRYGENSYLRVVILQNNLNATRGLGGRGWGGGGSKGQKLMRFELNEMKSLRINIEEEGLYEIRNSLEVPIERGLKGIEGI